MQASNIPSPFPGQQKYCNTTECTYPATDITAEPSNVTAQRHNTGGCEELLAVAGGVPGVAVYSAGTLRDTAHCLLDWGAWGRRWGCRGPAAGAGCYAAISMNVCHHKHPKGWQTSKIASMVVGFSLVGFSGTFPSGVPLRYGPCFQKRSTRDHKERMVIICTSWKAS